MREFCYLLPRNVIGIFSGRSLWWHASAIVLTIVIVTSGGDWAYYQWTRAGAFFEMARPALGLGMLIPVVGPLALLVASLATENRRLKMTPWALGQAALLAFLVTSCYKAVTGRRPPPFSGHFGTLALNGSAPMDSSHGFRFGFLKGGIFWGWPSGHTTVAFSVALCLIMLYPKNKIIVLCALLYAFYVGLAVSVTIHWFSEFAAGAIIGSLIGMTVGRSFRTTLLDDSDNFPGRKIRLRRAWTLLAVIGGILAEGAVCAQNSPLKTAPARLRLERIAQTDWPAKVGVADIAPCWSAPSRFGVFDADGKPVAFETIWTAQGEAMRVCFDTSSGAATYYICFDTNLPAAAGGWKPEAGVLVETRPCRGDLAIDTSAEVARVLSAGGPISGRDFVPNIFLGANPFGPSTNYIATFSGWFAAPNTGQYTFATDSSGASFLAVDNRTVAAWYGAHGPQNGRHGEHAGTVMLSAGVHHLSYAQIQFGGASAAVAAWKPPGSDHVELMPASAFGPVARFRVTRCEWASPGAERVYFEWRAVEQCALGDGMFVEVQFRVVDNSQRRSYRWQFDDGGRETGPNARHFFPQPGLRQVGVEALQNGVVVATNSIRARINPEWEQREWWRENVYAQARSDFLRRDLALMPARDLIAVWELAERAEDVEMLRQLGGTLMKRRNDFNGPAYAPTFYKAGLAFEHQGDSGDTLAGESFRLALAPPGVAPAVSLQAKLHLAALLIHCTGQLDEAGKLLEGVSRGLPGAEDRRLWRLLQGDLSLARGKKEEARKEYAAAGEMKAVGEINLARAALLESAAILLEHGQWDDAQAALDRLELEMPLERMSLDTGLLGLRLDMGRKEFQRALTDGQTLLAAAGDDPRQSEALFAVVQSGLALGKQEEAQRALGRLLKDFPYSEAAAKAKDKWSNH